MEIDSRGGSPSAAIDLYDSIKKLKRHLHVCAHGIILKILSFNLQLFLVGLKRRCYSAAIFILLAAETIYISKEAKLMIHTISTTMPSMVAYLLNAPIY
jgi:ATP-dependent protease ClpP protease subunit